MKARTPERILQVQRSLLKTQKTAQMLQRISLLQKVRIPDRVSILEILL